MVSHVLVALDGSPQAEAALEFALAEFPGADLTLLHVIDPVEGGYATGGPVPTASQEWFEQATADAEELFEAARDRAEESGHRGEIDTAVEVGRPARTIVDVAAESGPDHVVVGSHGRTGVARVLLGSVAETVVRRSPVPVTVVR